MSTKTQQLRPSFLDPINAPLRPVSNSLSDQQRKKRRQKVAQAAQRRAINAQIAVPAQQQEFFDAQQISQQEYADLLYALVLQDYQALPQQQKQLSQQQRKKLLQQANLQMLKQQQQDDAKFLDARDKIIDQAIQLAQTQTQAQVTDEEQESYRQGIQEMFESVTEAIVRNGSIGLQELESMTKNFLRSLEKNGPSVLRRALELGIIVAQAVLVIFVTYYGGKIGLEIWNLISENILSILMIVSVGFLIKTGNLGKLLKIIKNIY